MSRTSDASNAVVQKWLSKTDVSDLTITKPSSDHQRMLLGKYMSMIYPVVEKIKSAFVGETGDIQVCLVVNLEDNKEISVQICHIDDEGQLKQRIEAKTPDSLQIIQSFVLDFPGAVFTTSTRKPACFFTVKHTTTLPRSLTSGGGKNISLIQDDNKVERVSDQKQSDQLSCDLHSRGMSEEDIDNKMSDITAQLKKSFAGYASFENFQKIIRDRTVDKITILV